MRVLICRADRDGYSITPETLRELAEEEKNDVVVCEYVSVRGGLKAPTVYIVVSDPKLASEIKTILQDLQPKKLTDPNSVFVRRGMATFQTWQFAQAVARTFCGVLAGTVITYYEGEKRQVEVS